VLPAVDASAYYDEPVDGKIRDFVEIGSRLSRRRE
jgi:hypothetical protein